MNKKLEKQNLDDCLNASTWRHLQSIARQHNLPSSNRLAKQDFIRSLSIHLSNEAIIRNIISQFGDSVHAAIEALISGNGMLHATTFMSAFGEIRRVRPWRKDEASGQHSQPEPNAPSELLYYAGLVYLIPNKPKVGTVQQIVVPQEILAILKEHRQESAQPVSFHPRKRPGQPADMLWHMALWLATIHQTTSQSASFTLRNNRWLTPNLLKTLTRRLNLHLDLGFIDQRSERRIPYLALLHFLAQTAQLVSTTPTPTLTPRGWVWANRPAAQQWQMLWQAWRIASDDLAYLCRFPWGAPKAQGVSIILERLAHLQVNQPILLTDFIQQVRLHDPYRLLGIDEETTTATVAGLCQYAFHWFGLLDISSIKSDAQDDNPDPHNALAQATDSIGPLTDPSDPDFFDEPWYQPDPLEPLLIRLTPHGAWLLDHPDWGEPTFPPRTLCQNSKNNPALIIIPTNAETQHLLQLAPYSQWQPTHQPPYSQHLTLAPEQIGHAAAHGTTIDQLFESITAALGRPPSRRLQQRLRNWAKAGTQVQLRALIALETNDTKLMRRLRNRALIRKHLGQPLSPTRITANPNTIPNLIKALSHIDLYVAPPAPLSTNQPTDNPTTSQSTNNPSPSIPQPSGSFLPSTRSWVASSSCPTPYPMPSKAKPSNN